MTVTELLTSYTQGVASIDDVVSDLSARVWRVKPRSEDQAESYAIEEAWMPGDSIDELVNAVRDLAITGEDYGRIVQAYQLAPKRELTPEQVINGEDDEPDDGEGEEGDGGGEEEPDEG